MENATGPLVFTASFPLDARFAATLGDLAAKLALTTGCDEAASRGLRDAVGEAFARALAEAGSSPGGTISLALETTDGSFSTDVMFGSRSLLHSSCPRTA